jgi:hypothetical protein
MANRSKIALVAVVFGGTALATNAFAANNYDSPDWSPMYVEPGAGSGPSVSAYKKHEDRSVPAPQWQLYHRTDRPR